MIRKSKFRNLEAKVGEREEWYQDITISSARIEGNPLATSSSFVAFPAMANHGATVDVRDLVNNESTLLRGHSSQVNALGFSPFHSDILSTGSEDESVKLWNASSGKELESYEKLGKHVLNVAFHPSADHVLAVGAMSAVHVLDVQSKLPVLTYKESNVDKLIDLCWEYSGRCLVGTSSDLYCKIIDPRSKIVVSNFKCHGGRKNARIAWCGSTDYFLTAGLSKMLERECKVWDPRNLTKEVHRTRIDAGTGTILPFYDTDTNLVFLSGKGDTNIRCYEFTSDAKMHPILNKSVGDVAVGMSLLPKVECDGNACEVVRMLKLATKYIRPVSFVVPRRNAATAFQEDLYPATASQVPAQSSADWFSGCDASPILESIQLSYFRKTKEIEKKEAAITHASDWNNSYGWGSAPSTIEKPTKVVEARKSPVRQISEKAIRLAKQHKNKFKYVSGTTASKASTYYNMKADITTSVSSQLITASANFWAAAGIGGGGPVMVCPLSAVGKFKDDAPVVNGHTLPVMDLAFSPFHDNVLATGSDDSTIKIWEIPSKGLANSLYKDDARGQLLGHSRGIRTVQFHPTADNVLATSSTDKTLRLWDIEAMKERSCTTNKYDDYVYSVSFNHDGSLLATTSRDRIVRVVDPRHDKTMSMGCGHDGSKTQHVVWCTKDASSYICTTGVNAMNQREIKLWDSRNLMDCINTKVIDTSGCQMIPIYDETTGIVYLSGKGDTRIMPYEVHTNESTLQIFECDVFQDTKMPPLSGITLLPSRLLDVHQVQVAKFLCLSQYAVYPVTFDLPRSEKLRKYFQDDIYGLAPSSTPSLSSAAFFSGETLPPVPLDLRPTDLKPLSEKPDEPIKTPKVLKFRKKIEKEDEEKKRQDEEFLRLQSLAVQRSSYHPNLSMGTSNDAANEVDSDSSDDKWDE